MLVMSQPATQSALVAKLLYFHQFITNNLIDPFLVGQDVLVVGDGGHQLLTRHQSFPFNHQRTSRMSKMAWACRSERP